MCSVLVLPSSGNVNDYITLLSFIFYFYLLIYFANTDIYNNKTKNKNKKNYTN